jgi:hypothetical protein
MESEMASDRVISDENFKRLQRLAVPLVDTLDTTLARILDSYEGLAGYSESVTSPISSVKTTTLPIERPYPPFDPPDLTHTKVTFASVGRKSLDTTTWNALLDELVRLAKRQLRDFSAVRKVSPVNLVEGEKVDDGYHFLADIGISVQGQSANDAWRGIAHIARAIDHRVQVHFFWRNKEKALHPGEGGCFQIDGQE